MIKLPKNNNFTPNPGDIFDGDIEGILSFNYSNYKLFNTKELPKIIDKETKRDVNKFKYDSNLLNIATYNIENFTISDGMERVEVLASQIKEELQTPDIIGLVEVGDDDGATPNSDLVSSKKTLEAIVNEIKKQTNIDYGYLNIDPIHGKDGGWPELHIRNVILYRKDRLTPYKFNQGNAIKDTKLLGTGKELMLSNNPGRIGNNEEFFDEVRKPLIGQFKFKDKNVFVIINHLKSKRSDDKIYSATQPVVRKSEIVREKQGTYINGFVTEINKKDKDAVILVMGDMNDFEFSKTLQNLKGDIMINAVEILPLEERHTYIYQGNSQVLDNILVNKKYAKNMNVDILNINSEFTKSQGYFSDHDPIFIQIEVE